MKLFNLFSHITNVANTMQDATLTIVYCTSPEGLSIKDSAALRDIIIAATPIDFTFLNPASFEIIFLGSELEIAQQLANTLKSYALEHEVKRFGVGVVCGNCLVEFNAEGRFASHPIGESITRAMKAAHQEANHN